MAEKFKDNSSEARDRENDPRAELAGNWAKMAASMVSPDANRGGRKGGGPAPLPVSALPVPEDEPETQEEEPKHLDLPRNSKGELTPAQRARLGLDLVTPGEDPAAQSAATAPEAPPAGPQPQPPSRPPAPRAQPPDDPASRPAHRPAAPAPAPSPAPAEPLAAAPEPAADGVPAQEQPGSAFDFRAMESEPEPTFDTSDAPALRPVDDGPRLAPVSDSGGPRLAPVRQATAPSDRARTTARRPESDAESARRKQKSEQKRSDGEDFAQVQRDRNVLSFGVAWTAFCVVVTGAIAFTSSMSGDPTASAGPGPLIPGLMSIALGWIVVVAARTVGKGWWVLMVIPMVVLLVGPYVYKNVWADNVEVAARSYLSTQGRSVPIDVDATSVVSATINTDRGCFSITRARKNYDTEVMVVTYQPETARQQADWALAPRYAGRIEAGGGRATARVFTFKAGRTPAIVSTPAVAPLDCKNTTSAPGTGGKRLDE